MFTPASATWTSEGQPGNRAIEQALGVLIQKNRSQGFHFLPTSQRAGRAQLRKMGEVNTDQIKIRHSLDQRESKKIDQFIPSFAEMRTHSAFPWSMSTNRSAYHIVGNGNT